MNTRIVSFSVSIASLLACATSIAQTQPPQVSLVPLPLPTGGSDVILEGIDAAGNVLGSVKIGSRYEVVEWVGGKTPVVFPRLSADQSNANLDYMAVAINKSGAVLASRPFAANPGNLTPGVYWDASRRPIAVTNNGSVMGLSDTGEISGWTAGPPNSGPHLPTIGARWTAASAQPMNLPYVPLANNPCGGDCDYTGGPISPNGKYIVGIFQPPFGHHVNTAIYVDGVPDSHFNDEDVRTAQITDGEVLIGARSSGIVSDIANNYFY